MTYKPGWTPQQEAAADRKIAHLNTDVRGGHVSVDNPTPRSATSASEIWRKAGKLKPPGTDIDHRTELQLGGADDITNMEPPDLSVNRSLGRQIQHVIANLKPDEYISHFKIGPRVK